MSLAYRLQADAFGGLDKSIERMLGSKKDEDAVVPFDRRAPQTRDGVGLKAGALRPYTGPSLRGPGVARTPCRPPRAPRPSFRPRSRLLVARPRQKRLAFLSKGSIGVVVRRRAMSA